MIREVHGQHASDGQSAAIGLALLPCALLSIALGCLSDGVHHDDDLTHFLMARWVRWFPEYLVHVWARPGATIPMAVLAWIGDRDVGWHACRILSALITGGTAWMAAGLAARMGVRHAWLVVLACYAQPLNVVLSATTLTETYTALYLTGALVLLHAERIRLASAVFSLALLTRHEVIVLLPLWWLAMLGSPPRRPSWSIRMTAVALALWAPAVHNLIFRAWLGDWPFRLFLLPGGGTDYTPTAPLSYLLPALTAISPFIAGLALIGGGLLIWRGQWLAPTLAGVYFAVHCVIRWRGLFASGGFARFMVAVAPLIAIAAVAGWNRLWERAGPRRSGATAWLALAAVWPAGLLAFEVERRAGRIAVLDPRVVGAALSIAIGVALIAVLTALAVRRRERTGWRTATIVVLFATWIVQSMALVRPLHLRPAQRRASEAAAWLKAQRLDDQPIFAANPWIAYFMGFVEDPRVHKGPALLASMPVGTVVVWDSIYCPSNYHAVELNELQNDPAHYAAVQMWKPDPADPQRLEIRVFRKVAVTPPRSTPDRPYPPMLMAPRKPGAGLYYVRER